jgi:glycosyltransferase involved in cell wall biosynthesis
MNILFLADPNSIHDLKWMRHFSKENNCFLVFRSLHANSFSFEQQKEFSYNYQIKVIGGIDDFSIKNFQKTLKTANFLKAIIEEHKIDIFHILFAEPNALWGFFRKKLNIPIIVTTRGTDILKTIPKFYQNKTILNRIVAFFYSKAFKNIDYFTCTSNHEKSSVLKISNNKLKNAEVIRVGVDIPKILSDTSAYRLVELDGKKYVFFPRNMYPIYQQEIAIAAINALPEHLLSEFFFVFVNKDSKDQSYVYDIKGLIDSSKAKIIWLNSMDQMTLYQTYKDASLVVMTPKSDGTPVSALEAMICKKPVILPPITYDEDLFKLGTIKAASWNYQDFTDLIKNILDGKVSIDTENSYNSIIEKVDNDKELKRLEKIYNTLVK